MNTHDHNLWTMNKNLIRRSRQKKSKENVGVAELTVINQN